LRLIGRLPHEINFLSWLGLGATSRTLVAKENCTLQSQNERCGKSFIFNQEFLVWYVLSYSEETYLGLASSYFIGESRKDFRKKLLEPYPFAGAEVMLSGTKINRKRNAGLRV